jgi:DNA-binding transcriptional ArsR family regulator
MTQSMAMLTLSEPEDAPVPSSVAIVFRAIAHPTRRDVLELLRPGPQSAGEIALAFPASRAAISKHVKELQRADLVKEERRGRNRFYSLNTQPLNAIERWLRSYSRFGIAWNQGLPFDDNRPASEEKQAAAKRTSIEIPSKLISMNR